MEKQKESNEVLFAKYKSGDKKAREKLILNNIPYVVYVFNKCMSCNADEFDDYFQIGKIGLIKDVESYKPGVSLFATYSYRCIQNEMLMAVNKQNRHKTISLEAPAFNYVKDEREDTVGDRISSPINLEEIVFESESKQAVKAFIKNNLPEDEKNILSLRYYSGDKTMTQNQVAKKLNITQSCVSRIEKSAIESIKTALAGEY